MRLNTNYWKRWARMALLTIAMLVIGLAMLPRASHAQTAPTPLPIVLPTQPPTPSPTRATPPSPSPVPTLAGSVVAEAIDATVGSNVRQSPDPNLDNILGKIFPNKHYQVIGVWAKWYEIQFPLPNSDTTVPGWVYSAVVKVTGPVNSLPQVDPGSGATLGPAVAAQSTANHLTATPGAPGSATALQGSATGVRTIAPNTGPDPTPGGPMPTFTYPPPFAEATLAPRGVAAGTSGGVPPIVPIIGLMVVGVLGLLIGVLRRG
ncbi:MAG: hypothetical protein ACYDBJ_22785 [Aggregatilineales bacterium]